MVLLYVVLLFFLSFFLSSSLSLPDYRFIIKDSAQEQQKEEGYRGGEGTEEGVRSLRVLSRLATLLAL